MNRHAKFLIRSVIALACVSASAVASAAPAPYLFQVLKKQPYRAAWEELLAQAKPVPKWLAVFSRTYNGVATPMEPLTLAGSAYEAYSVCKPHDCFNNRLEVIFTARGERAWGALVEDGKPARIIGPPNPAIAGALNQILNTNK